MIKNLARLTKLEQRSAPPAVQPCYIIKRRGEKIAQIVTLNSQETPEGVAARARLEAEGYVVKPGYGRWTPDTPKNVPPVSY